MRWSMPLTVLAAAAAAACVTNPAAEPHCSSPAPLLGQAAPTPSYIVVYREGTAARAVTDQLAAKYSFTPRHVYETALPGFAADLSPAMLAGIRCEAVVRHVEYDRSVTIPR